MGLGEIPKRMQAHCLGSPSNLLNLGTLLKDWVISAKQLAVRGALPRLLTQKILDRAGDSPLNYLSSRDAYIELPECFEVLSPRVKVCLGVTPKQM